MDRSRVTPQSKNLLLKSVDVCQSYHSIPAVARKQPTVPRCLESLYSMLMMAIPNEEILAVRLLAVPIRL